jgi:hypothetical protein
MDEFERGMKMDNLTEDTANRLRKVNHVILNMDDLKQEGRLEEEWIEAYLFSSCFLNVPFADLKKVFDACDREKLQKLRPLPSRDPSQNHNPFTVFRGCVGSEFREGMSWTTDLYQAIKYPKHAKLYELYPNIDNEPCSVWVALVYASEIYCCLKRNEPEFIVCPVSYWRVDIPQELFSYSKPLGT